MSESSHAAAPDTTPDTASDRLFVYGTLAPGRPNAHILAPLHGSWQPGTVRGHLKYAGWGADLGFPGLTPDPAGAAVPGLVFTAPTLAAFWPELDAFEGEGYVRVLVDAEMEDGSTVPAFIYVLNG